MAVLSKLTCAVLVSIATLCSSLHLASASTSVDTAWPHAMSLSQPTSYVLSPSSSLLQSNSEYGMTTEKSEVSYGKPTSTTFETRTRLPTLKGPPHYSHSEVQTQESETPSAYPAPTTFPDVPYTDKHKHSMISRPGIPTPWSYGPDETASNDDFPCPTASGYSQWQHGANDMTSDHGFPVPTEFGYSGWGWQHGPDEMTSTDGSPIPTEYPQWQPSSSPGPYRFEHPPESPPMDEESDADSPPFHGPQNDMSELEQHNEDWF